MSDMSEMSDFNDKEAPFLGSTNTAQTNPQAPVS